MSAAPGPGPGGPEEMPSAPALAGSGYGSRILALDVARSLALVAMVCFHFGVDLELFGLAPAGMSREGGWWWAARLIAGSFLFLAGVSQVLAHGSGVRWRAFWRRQIILILAAGGVTLATWFAMPDVFIWYGILHSIAVSSLIGIALIRLPALAVLALAAAVFAIGNLWSSPLFDHPLLWWTGLQPAWHARSSLDFEPLFPWAAAFLAGQGAGKLADAAGLWQALRGRGGRVLWLAGWPGRHSLAVYLIHQPLLFAGFAAARALWAI